MQPGPEARGRATPSPFAAGVLSLLFPGLGQAYVGAWWRALWWAAPPLLLMALGVGVFVRLDKFTLAGLAVQGWFLTAVFVGNLAVLAYRAASVIDAWRLARAMGSRAGRTGQTAPETPGLARELVRSLSVAGLAAVILVLAGVHVAVARYDLLVANLANCVFDQSGTADCGQATSEPGPEASPSGGESSQPTISLPPEGTALPNPTLPGWTGTGRLNILLVGIDQRPGDTTFNTDTMIVVSIDPATKRVAMFSIPRDTVNVPMPPGPLRNAIGAVYPDKINSFWAAVRGRPDLCPGANATTRGFNCLKSVIGYLFGLDVPYYAEVNFTGFRKVVDALGGVTIDVQSPVVDDRFPGDNGTDLRVYIPAGIQHMDGAQALIYARSRHASNDFDRGARQQRVLTSLLAQADFSAIISHLDDLVSAFEQTVRTDIPREIVPQLLDLAKGVDTKAIHSFVFAPPLYETEDYVPGVHDFIYPNVPKIRSAVNTAFTADPAFEAELEKIAAEGATLWVLNGTGVSGSTEASDLAAYLGYLGFDATAPTQKPPKAVSATKIVVYNGAEQRLPETIAKLQAVFGVTVTTKTDPTVHVDIVITVGRTTPAFSPPPIP